MATQEQRQNITVLWRGMSAVGFRHSSVSKQSVRTTVELFLQEMRFPSDARKFSTLTTAMMGVVPNLEAEIDLLLGFLYPSSSASGSGSSSASDSSEAWSQRFNAPFIDPGGQVVTYFCAKLDRCVSQFYNSRNIWYAPCVAIVQSSGWGKSKLIKHMASQGLLVFYFSLMAQSSSGYPRADVEIAERLTSVTTEQDAYAIFYACLLWLIKQGQWPDTEQFFLQQQTLQWPQELKQMILKREACTLADMKQAFKDVWKKSKPRAGASILFVLDEARQLLQLQAKPEEEARDTAFTLLRRACRQFIWKPVARSGALLVVIDTLGKVSNLAPRPHLDPSARVATAGFNLLNPISAMPTFNLRAEANENTLEAVSEHLTLFTRGRPLWDASLKFVTDKLDDEKISELLELAQVKLLGGQGFHEFSKQPISSLAVLGRRIAVELCPQDRSVEELVASHMHVCLYISRSREFMLTLVPPEPVLAEAAKILLESPDIVHHQLLHLNTCMLKGLVSAGERGELVGRFLLLNAMDELNNGLVRPEYLKDFLMKLTKGKWKGFGSGSEPLNKAKVFFNAFYPYFGKKATFKVLQQYLKNAGAIVCRQGQRACDLYIPIVFEDYDLSKLTNVSYLAVQIKNKKDFMNSQGILQHMSNEAVNIVLSDDGMPPSIVILLQFGSNESEPKLYERTLRQGMLGIALDGLSVINYPLEWHESLLVLLRERPDPKSVICSYEAENIDVGAVSNILRDLRNPKELELSDDKEPAGKQSGKRNKAAGKQPTKGRKA